MKKFVSLASTALVLGSVAVPVLAQAEEDFSVVMVTDTGGVDDKSFNQGAWEGLTAFGEENGLEKGKGYHYLQSASDSDYVTNLELAVAGNFDVTFGIGYKLAEAIQQVAEANPERHFAIVDSMVDLPNVASIGFKDHEASFLAGVAAAKTTKTNKIGFIGGIKGEVIDRFEAGFVAGVKAVNPDIKVEVQYADSFSDAAKGKQLASAMYANDIDVVFHAAGGVGEGVFTEAKDIVKNDPTREIWVVGVDRDQDAEGIVEVEGKERHLTLTSTLKGVGAAVKKVSEDAKAGNFKAGVTTFGLEDNGVGLSDGQLTDDVKAAVAEFKEKIIKGEIEVPEKP
ncbi:BMP family protein [Aerococcaceae bacterium zg-ZJ1578]|uniref:BMP family lipoprotein n=1 Tax=Aerococcaceae TaxID=186827 RepID=UPI0013B85ED8|nr:MULTISPECIES: BMP family protein [unclassified Facklamia]MBK0348943.1 BMP family protein [Aerococcaceae bacterium zg-1578]MBR7928101.1 BMP family protein [Aerococcaceae bacterium zg-ZUI334]MBS4462671.1 BMP family protein [Aerococcaceae bacterium zg-B36]QQD66206.1 BMP family protein [Aerococcaceae bacterium zg-252]NEW65211.1 BMP family ABC transporter substrate-binding protein [Facklamia sp. 252]